MTYIVTKNIRYARKLTLEDIWSGSTNELEYKDRSIGTKTYYYETLPLYLKDKDKILSLITHLRYIWATYSHLNDVDRKTLYDTWYVPKKSGRGMRRIDSPKPELKEALSAIQYCFESMMNGNTHHTSSYAYAKQRATIHLVRKHQSNNSRWFAHFDFSDFFGSITIEFVMKMLSEIYPFSEIVKLSDGRVVMENLLGLCFLNGGLPQGSPASPIITNIMMIPIDFTVANQLLHNKSLDVDFHFQDGENDTREHRLIYTRYADDIYISCRYGFSVKALEEYMRSVLNKFDVPFSINENKTRYHSSSGSNWILGVMLNRDNEITIGHKEKKRFKSMLYNYVNAKLNNERWDIGELQHLQGKIAYYESVEGDNIRKIINDYSNKYNLDIKKSIIADISGIH